MSEANNTNPRRWRTWSAFVCGLIVGFLAALALVSDGRVASNSSAPRIIHLCDWHFVSRDDFAADLQSQSDAEPVPEAEIDELYTAFLKGVEAVQESHVWILRDLIAQHGVKAVFVEGVTPENVERFRSRVQELRDIDPSELQRRLDDAEGVADQALALVTLETDRQHRLELGAVGQLLLSGELQDVLPLDDERLLKAANPVAHGFIFDGQANQARENAMVERMIRSGPISIVILGGGHDLAAAIKRVALRAEYLRIATAAYREASGDRN